jgi:hypothetical protein
MKPLQPDIPVSDKIPVIMVETVAPSSKRIAPKRAQSGTIPMLRFGRSKMLEVTEHFSEMNRRFLTVETGLYAMTLTPPCAGKRAAGSRLAWPLVARHAGKITDEPNTKQMKRRRSEQGKAVKLPMDKPATAMRLESQDGESSAHERSNQTL